MTNVQAATSKIIVSRKLSFLYFTFTVIHNREQKYYRKTCSNAVGIFLLLLSD